MQEVRSSILLRSTINLRRVRFLSTELCLRWSGLPEAGALVSRSERSERSPEPERRGENQLREFPRKNLPKWRNGIRAGLKNHCLNGRVGSTPTFGIFFRGLYPEPDGSGFAILSFNTNLTCLILLQIVVQKRSYLSLFSYSLF